MHLREKLSYGAGDFASCLYWVYLNTFLPNFYTDVFGIWHTTQNKVYICAGLYLECAASAQSDWIRSPVNPNPEIAAVPTPMSLPASRRRDHPNTLHQT